jgi:hypothetical protein
MLKMCLLLLAYAIAPMVAGHGIAPLAMLLIRVEFLTWQLALSWGAIIVVVAASTFLRAGTLAQLVAQLAGTVVLYGSWLANIHYINQFNEQAEQGMALESMLVFSLPFQLATVVVMCVLAVQLKRALSNPQDGFPR